jgi:MFS transporter, DHA1 family, multidrug resistance protein
MRTLQGVGAGAAAALPAAIVRDAYSGHMALTRQSYVALVNAIGPLVAPLIGVTVMRFGDWRTIYATLGVVGVVLFVVILLGYEETAPGKRDPSHHAAAPRQHVLAAAFTAYRHVLRDKNYLLSTGVLAMTFGAMFSYISSSSIVFMGVMGVSAGIYAMLFGLSALGGIAGAACNARLAPRFGGMRMLYAAAAVSLLASLSLVLIASLGLQTVPACAALVVLNNFCAGIAMPNATHQALQQLGKVAGSAAALQRSLQMAFGALASALVGILSPNPVMGMAASMAIFAVLSCLLLIIRHRHAE